MSSDSNTRHTTDTEQQTVLTVDPIIYEQPTVITHYNIGPTEDDIKLIIYSRSKVVRFLALIDIVFLSISLLISFLNNNTLWFFLITFPLCFCGYNGAIKYKKFQVLIYNIYLFSMAGFYILLSFY